MTTRILTDSVKNYVVEIELRKIKISNEKYKITLTETVSVLSCMD